MHFLVALSVRWGGDRKLGRFMLAAQLFDLSVLLVQQFCLGLADEGTEVMRGGGGGDVAVGTKTDERRVALASPDRSQTSSAMTKAPRSGLWNPRAYQHA